METKKFYTLEELYKILIALKKRTEHTNKVYTEHPTEVNLKLKKYIDNKSTEFFALCDKLNAFDDLMEAYFNGGCGYGNKLKYIKKGE